MTEPRLDGKVALVTGGGTGIGYAIARELGRLGAATAINQRTQAKGEAAAERLRAEGVRAVAVTADLSSAQGCRQAVRGCVDAFGALHILVNNAAVTGTGAVGPLLEFDDERLDRIVDTNLKGPFRCAREAARVMEDGGVIVNVGSVAAYAAQHEATAYAATKAGLVGLTRGLALELAPRGIRVVHVAPGAIDTETSSTPEFLESRAANPFRRRAPMGRHGTADEIAKVVAFLCTPGAGYVTGTSLVVDGGLLSY